MQKNAGIPDEIKYHAKWKMALEQYFRAAGNGVVFDWLTFDEGYGSKPLFVSALAIAKQKFAGEIPKSFAVDGPDGSSRRADVVLPESKAKKENRYRFKRETLSDQVWRATGKEVMVDGFPMTLVVAQNETSKEVKYF
ncbi:MAG: transposase [Gemmataceae bacterium]